MSQPPSPLGLIGLGLMGQALTSRLLAGNYSVIGHDLSPGRLAEFTALGGHSATSPLEVAQRAQTILLSLPDHHIVAEVIAQMAPALQPGCVIIDTTTGDPQAAAELGDKLAALGVDYLDAEISGSSAQVARGEVLVMAGGTAGAFKQCAKIFASFAQKAVHTGPCGSGTKMKLVTNLVLGLNRAALAEGLAFAGELDLHLSQTLEILRESMAYSRIMDTKGEKMIREDFVPQARLAQHLKDVRLMLTATKLHLPLSEAHRTVLERAVNLGFGEADNSAIIKAIQKTP